VKIKLEVASKKETLDESNDESKLSVFLLF
jgi:hypothetical protein